MSRFAAILFILLVCLSALPLCAQTNFGRISGTITDTSGAAIAGAKVIVKNADTQSMRTVNSDDRGFFVAENLPIGPYSVTVDHPGFRRAEHTGLFVVADGRVSADFRLQIGDTTTAIEVSAV